MGGDDSDGDGDGDGEEERASESAGDGCAVDPGQEGMSLPREIQFDFSQAQRIFLRLRISDSGRAYQLETRPFRLVGRLYS